MNPDELKQAIAVLLGRRLVSNLSVYTTKGSASTGGLWSACVVAGSNNMTSWGDDELSALRGLAPLCGFRFDENGALHDPSQMEGLVDALQGEFAKLTQPLHDQIARLTHALSEHQRALADHHKNLAKFVPRAWKAVAGEAPEQSESLDSLLRLLERRQTALAGRDGPPNAGELLAQASAFGRWRCFVPACPSLSGDGLHEVSAAALIQKLSECGFASRWWATDVAGNIVDWPGYWPSHRESLCQRDRASPRCLGSKRMRDVARTPRLLLLCVHGMARGDTCVHWIPSEERERERAARQKARAKMAAIFGLAMRGGFYVF